LNGETPVLTFADGNQLEWLSTRALTGASPPPSPAQPEVWVKFVRDVTVVCPYCGSYVDDSIEMRDEPEGQLLFFSLSARQFALEQFAELFGVQASSIRNCLTDPVRESCYDAVVRQAYDHEISTSPAVTLPYGATANVDTPSGRFALSWMSTTVAALTRVLNCSDGMTPASRAQFEARLVLE
jgi:hypothetical protein